MANRPSVSSLWLPFLWGWFPLCHQPCEDLWERDRGGSQHLPTSASSPFFCLPHTGHLKVFYHFSLLPISSPYQNPPGTSRFIPRSQLKVQVFPSPTLLVSSHQANNNISHTTTIIIRWLQLWCGISLLKSVYKIKTTWSQNNLWKSLQLHIEYGIHAFTTLHVNIYIQRSDLARLTFIAHSGPYIQWDGEHYLNCSFPLSFLFSFLFFVQRHIVEIRRIKVGTMKIGCDNFIINTTS